MVKAQLITGLIPGPNVIVLCWNYAELPTVSYAKLFLVLIKC